jgi:hypothetical protein
MKAIETTAGWRRMGNLFLGVFVPVFHIACGYFILEFILTADYTWGRTMRIFVVFLSNVVLGYEFVYRDLQTTHPDWPKDILQRSVMKYSVIPFLTGMAAAVMLHIFRYGAR